jgi:hypothetical protein
MAGHLRIGRAAQTALAFLYGSGLCTTVIRPLEVGSRLLSLPAKLRFPGTERAIHSP